MKIKVIFMPYCNLATIGLSELERLSACTHYIRGRLVHKVKHLSADREGERNDQNHEERHFCYKEQEDLCNMLAGLQKDTAAWKAAELLELLEDLRDCSRESS